MQKYNTYSYVAALFTMHAGRAHIVRTRVRKHAFLIQVPNEE